MAFNSPFGLAMVFLGRDPEPEVEAAFTKLTHAVNQQTSVVTAVMTAILKQFQATQPPASVKSVEEICVTCGGAHPNTIANPKGELKAITARSGLVLDGPFVHMPPPFINSEEDERVEETLTDLKLTEYTIKVPPPPVQKAKSLSQRNYVVHQMDPRHPHIPYPSRMNQEKHELKCKALAYLGASINLMPLSVLEKLDVFVPVGKFTFPADFVIIDYESDPRVSLILGRPFLRTTHALLDVHGEEMILRDGDERLTLKIRHDTSIYSNQPQKESINLINVFNSSSEDFLEQLFLNQPSGNPTFFPHPELTLLEVNNDSTKDLHPPLHDNQLSDSTTYFSNLLLKEFADELPLEYDDNLPFDI
nr:hypothetical protein [Tanacetum cinerariifolium]